MSLYWPEQHVALEIIDDPLSEPFDRSQDPEATVVRTTVAEISDPKSFRVLAARLSAALGQPLPADTPEFRKRQTHLHEAVFSRISLDTTHL